MSLRPAKGGLCPSRTKRRGVCRPVKIQGYSPLVALDLDRVAIVSGWGPTAAVRATCTRLGCLSSM
jgi:hypothetical protein